MSTQRTTDEIRASIEEHRLELAAAVAELTVGVNQATDWRLQVARHPQQLGGAAVAAGFLLGGGIVALGGLLSLNR